MDEEYQKQTHQYGKKCESLVAIEFTSIFERGIVFVATNGQPNGESEESTAYSCYLLRPGNGTLVIYLVRDLCRVPLVSLNSGDGVRIWDTKPPNKHDQGAQILCYLGEINNMAERLTGGMPQTRRFEIPRVIMDRQYGRLILATSSGFHGDQRREV